MLHIVYVYIMGVFMLPFAGRGQRAIYGLGESVVFLCVHGNTVLTVVKEDNAERKVSTLLLSQFQF